PWFSLQRDKVLRVMVNDNRGLYERIRKRRAQRLAQEIFGEKPSTVVTRPNADELARLEEERKCKLVEDRRQREAALVADFGSDEIYDLDDEGRLGMNKTLRESRARIQAFCEGRRLADRTELVVDGLLKELRTLLNSCNLYIAELMPGSNKLKLIGTTDSFLTSPPV
ncbi:unnamed protein product, partial [Discosporangium mesarthrocarpum]